MNSDDKKHQHTEDDSQSFGEQTISGDAPDPESDDNVLDSAHEMGLYTNADEEHPQELGVAKKIEKDQKADG